MGRPWRQGLTQSSRLRFPFMFFISLFCIHPHKGADNPSPSPVCPECFIHVCGSGGNMEKNNPPFFYPQLSFHSLDMGFDSSQSCERGEALGYFCIIRAFRRGVLRPRGSLRMWKVKTAPQIVYAPGPHSWDLEPLSFLPHPLLPTWNSHLLLRGAVAILQPESVHLSCDLKTCFCDFVVSCTLQLLLLAEPHMSRDDHYYSTKNSEAPWHMASCISEVSFLNNREDRISSC